MRLIAKKPCNFCGKQFFIGEEIPQELVVNPEMQERLGVISIMTATNKEEPDNKPGSFTLEQVNNMISEAVARKEKQHKEQLAEVVKKYEEQLAERQSYVAELIETESGAYDGTILIAVKVASDGENEQVMSVPAKPEEIQQAFSIMQMSVDEGVKQIASVTSENVLILLHAADSRKTVQNAAKGRADKLFPSEGDSRESNTDNATTGTNTEGADT